MSIKNKKWIIADLPGGLGNQLFTYYFATSLIQERNYELFFNTRYIDLNHSNGNSSITGYRFDSNIRFFDFGYLLNRIIEPFKRYLGALNKFHFLRIMVLDDTNQNYLQGDIQELIKERNPKVIIIFGFWQDLANFKFENRLTLNNPSTHYKELLTRMTVDNPIVFHYRLGRKNGTWEHAWGALGAKYLGDAMTSIIERNPQAANLPIWVFSNDLEDAKRILSEIKGLAFIDDSNLSPCELFELISKSNNLICSNSTFSVLAGQVGEVENVAIPREMSRDGKAKIDGLPELWLRIEPTWME